MGLNPLGSDYTRNKSPFLYNKTSNQWPQVELGVSGSTPAWIYSLGMSMNQGQPHHVRHFSEGEPFRAGPLVGLRRDTQLQWQWVETSAIHSLHHPCHVLPS